jgi:membrane-associated protease RseP (regulator of RpoE activity)
MIGMPSPTPYDLNFRLFRIPVRVSPWFWLGGVMLCGTTEPKEVFLFVLCLLVSILVHEFGHGLTFRAFGYRSEIALFALGGLCRPLNAERETNLQRFVVSAMGPGAQLILLALTMLFGSTVLGIEWSAYPHYALSLIGLAPRGPLVLGVAEITRTTELLATIFQFLFIINLLWPLLNVLPIWPLDGGQMLHAVLTQVSPRHGARRTHIVSMVVAGLLTAYVLRQFVDQSDEGSLFRLLFFAWFVLMNYQMLTHLQRQYEVYGYDDEADWWKR